MLSSIALAPSLESATSASTKPRWLRHITPTPSPLLSMPRSESAFASRLERSSSSARISAPRLSMIASASGERRRGGEAAAHLSAGPPRARAAGGRLQGGRAGPSRDRRRVQAVAEETGPGEQVERSKSSVIGHLARASTRTRPRHTRFEKVDPVDTRPTATTPSASPAAAGSPASAWT